jgi:hypothetical protein
MLAGIPTQTRDELLTDMEEIAALREKYNIFSVMYPLYNLGKFQPFYQERDKYGIQIISRRRIFCTVTPTIVHGDPPLYRYKDKSAYHLLRDCENTEVDSPFMAILQLAKTFQEFELLKKEEMPFIFTINDFLFETQLLFSKDRSRYQSRGFFNRLMS